MSTEHKQHVSSWLRDRLVLQGVLAVGAGFADGSVTALYAAPEFILAQNEEIWTAIATALPRLHSAGSAAGEIHWQFEGAALWTALRPDGAWTGVFVPLQLPLETVDQLRIQFAEFRAAEFETPLPLPPSTEIQ